jgi:ferritin-like metal-binding protein YciE
MSTTTTAAIASYITDMSALEEHLEKAIAGQLADIEDDPATTLALREVHGAIQRHIASLDALAERRKEPGQGLAENIKKAASIVLGAGAAAVDFVRTEKLPKNLRDDYTAVSMACIGYVMLHTTALSLGDSEVAELAHRHLKDHAKSVMTLHNAIPAVVIRFLQEEGLPASADVLTTVATNIEAVWKGDDVPSADDAAFAGSRPR